METMTAKIVVDRVLNEVRLYRQLLEEELPVYLGTTFWIEEDNSGKYWLYVMTLPPVGECNEV